MRMRSCRGFRSISESPRKDRSLYGCVDILQSSLSPPSSCLSPRNKIIIIMIDSQTHSWAGGFRISAASSRNLRHPSLTYTTHGKLTSISRMGCHSDICSTLPTLFSLNSLTALLVEGGGTSWRPFSSTSGVAHRIKTVWGDRTKSPS